MFKKRKKKKDEVKVKVEPIPKREFVSFRWHRVLHGGTEICKILNGYKKVYNIKSWDAEPSGNQFILIVELEEK